MDMDEVICEIKSIVSAVSSVPVEEIAPDAHFVTDLQIGSFDIIMIIGEIEERYDIDVPRDVLYKLDTLEKVIDYLSDIM